MRPTSSSTSPGRPPTQPPPPAPPAPPSELERVLEAWNVATERLQKTHETLRDEVGRLTDEPDTPVRCHIGIARPGTLPRHLPLFNQDFLRNQPAAAGARVPASDRRGRNPRNGEGHRPADPPFHPLPPFGSVSIPPDRPRFQYATGSPDDECAGEPLHARPRTGRRSEYGATACALARPPSSARDCRS